MRTLKEWYRKLVPLQPNRDTSARLVLERTLDKADRIKAVVVVIQWDDETFDADWSIMKVGEFSMASLVLQEEARRRVLRVD